jgi:TonB-dependent starch-binding outer membrane protein SusC
MHKPKPIQYGLLFYMKVTLIHSLIVSLSAIMAHAIDSSGQEVLDRKVTIQVENTEVKSVLLLLEEKAGVVFTYRPKLVHADDKVSINFEDAKLADVLATILSDDIAFKVVGNQIALKRKEPAGIILNAPAATATEVVNVKVSGKVLDETGQPVPGVNVVVKGSNRGTVTDTEGVYTIEVDDDNVILVFSFIGYMTQEVAVNAQTTIDVTLQSDITSLNEVVVIGYGEVKRSDLTGSVVSMNTDEIKRANKVDAFSSLQGQVSGVVIQRADNKPGGGFTMRIRGAGTINKNETVDQGGFVPGQNPLFVVDGIFVNDITFLNPSDIERMDVLKDASATAIYGSRGTNGVVIIKTKKGSTGKLTVQYDNYFGVKQAYHLPPIFKGREFVEFAKDAVVGTHFASGDFTFDRDDVDLSTFLKANELENIANNEYVDWVDLILKTGFQMNHTLSLGGGTEKTTYGFGLAYTRDDGTLAGEDYQRVNLRGSVSSELSKYVTIGYNNYVTLSVRNEGSREQLRSAYRLRPTGDAYDENGEKLFFPIESETFITNPLFEADNATMETKTLNYLGNLSLSVTPVENLKFTTNFAPNISFTRFAEYRGLYSKATSGVQANTRAEVVNSNKLSYTWDNIVNYNLTFDKIHALSATLVYSRFLDRYEGYTMQRRNFATDDYSFYNIDAGSVIAAATGGFSKQSLESYTGRLSYSLLDKYLLTLTGRYDGSSILAKNNKWAFFPSAAFAWKAIEEPFMNAQSVVSDLKLRLSYGETGNNGAGGGLVPLGSQSLFNNSTYTNLGDNAILTAYITGLSNQDLTWERMKEVNIGVDYGFLKNRITGSLEIYNRKTEGIIFFRNLPTLTGYSGVFDNVGEQQNKGIELSINTVNIDKGGFKWTTAINFAKNTNKITKLYSGVEREFFNTQGAPYVNEVGKPGGSIYEWQFDGIWQLEEAAEAQSYGAQPGQVRAKDIDDDGDVDADDRAIVGNPAPKWTGGITSTMNYKGIDLSFMLYTSQGATSYSWFHRSHAWDGDAAPARFNGLKTNYWTPENPSNEWYQPGNPGAYRPALSYYDVSYVKVGYITLGYQLPQQIIDRLKVGSLRVYATVQNPFIFTDYEGWDPENASRNSWGSGYMSRTYMAGVNLKF